MTFNYGEELYIVYDLIAEEEQGGEETFEDESCEDYDADTCVSIVDHIDDVWCQGNCLDGAG